MILKRYDCVPRVNDILMARFRRHPRASAMHWAVMELIDGDHVALYYNYTTKEFKVSARNKFVFESDNYSCSKEIISLYKEWVVLMGEVEKSDIVVYGKAVGGQYKKSGTGVSIKTVCSYMEDNGFIIHDIHINGSFVDVMKLQTIAKDNMLTVAPLLYTGTMNKCFGYPENGLSAIPFMLDLPADYENEMKGIIIRPIYNLTDGAQRIIMKKLNRAYIGWTEKKKPSPVITESLIDVALWMDNAAMRMTLMDAILFAVGDVTTGDVKRVAGRYVSTCIEKINYVKYNILHKEEKRLVHKHLNKLAEERIQNFIRKDSAA